jgi:hypothetical protein
MAKQKNERWFIPSPIPHHSNRRRAMTTVYSIAMAECLDEGPLGWVDIGAVMQHHIEYHDEELDVAS